MMLDAGTLIYEETLDGTIGGVPELTIKNARTAAVWCRLSQTFQDAVKKSTNIAYRDGTFPDMTLSPGGVPLFVGANVLVDLPIVESEWKAA